MYIIGFTTRYYTLWDVQTSKTKTQYEEVISHSYTYIKNISYSLSEVHKQYPDVPIDLSLKGSTSFVKNETIDLILDSCFKFGKYKAQDIESCSDIKYILWYADQIDRNSENFIAVKNKLESEGYVFMNNYFYTKEDIEYIEQDENDFKAFKKMFTSGNEEPVISFDKNLTYDESLDDFCYCIWFGNHKVVVTFKETKTMEYNGYLYALPVKKNAGKKIKNKDVIIKKFEIKENDEYTLRIEVIDFEIKK